MNYKTMNVVSPRPIKNGGKTLWHQVGKAFLKADGSISIEFNSLPLPDADGRCRVQLFEPRDDKAKHEPTSTDHAPDPDFGDEVPF